MEETNEEFKELEEEFKDWELLSDEALINNICPVCESSYLIKEGHCTFCYECGWSVCSI